MSGMLISDGTPAYHRVLHIYLWLQSRSAASTVLSAIYAWPPITKADDALVNRINDLMHRLVRSALPGAYLVEIFPAMKHLPTWMAKWKREGLEWHRKDTEMFQGFYDDVNKTMASAFAIAAVLERP